MEGGNGGGKSEKDYGSAWEGTKRDLLDATLFLCATAMGVVTTCLPRSSVSSAKQGEESVLVPSRCSESEDVVVLSANQRPFGG